MANWKNVLAATVLTLSVSAVCGQGVGVTVPNPDATTAPAATGPASQPTDLAAYAEYADLTRVAKLTDEQLKALKERIGQSQLMIGGFLKAREQEWKETMQKATSATDAKDRQAAIDKLKEFNEKFEAFRLQEDGKVLSGLTAEQRLAWEQFKLNRDMTNLFTTLQIGHLPTGEMGATRTPPSPEVTKAIQELVPKTAKAIQELKDPYDFGARQKLIAKLIGDIRDKAGPTATSAPEHNSAPEQ